FKRIGRTAHRVTDRKTDVVTVDLIRKPLCRKWNVPYGATAIEPACFLPFVPSLERADFQCCRAAEVKPVSALECQVRFGVNRGFSQSEVRRAPNLWFVDLEESEQEIVLLDMLRVLDNEVLPFFAGVEDLARFLHYLHSGKNNIGSVGMWNIG